MAILDTLDEVKVYLEGIKKKYRFRKSRIARQESVELQTTLAKCRGKLEICKKDLNRAINTQSKNISEGLKLGADTIIQEQILWDAAIGYMLVGDAIYALETINSYDSVAHAYEMLEAAMKQVAGKKSEFPSSMKIGSTKERNAYGYITSSTALRAKQEMLESFFEQLKVTGDIESHLAAARSPAARQAELRHAYTKDSGSAGMGEAISDIDALMGRLSSVDDSALTEEDTDFNMESMMDIHPPKNSL